MTNSAQPPDGSSASILIVDDHAAVRAGLRTLISSRRGWFICGEAANGEQAVSSALELRPSAIVMDISMPGMNGLEATRRIREQIPGIEILIVSQHDSEQVVFEAQRAGARGFVVKSHLSADLLPALEAALLHSSRISAPVSKAWHDAMASSKFTPSAPLIDPGPHDDLDLMSGGGQMGALMRSHDWAETPFGPVSQWPQSLRTALRICLDSRFPIVIWWGPELRLLYNDAWRPALGTTKHPQALGAPGMAVWSDVWDTIGPMLEIVMRTGQATWENDQLLLFDRHGYVEESYWTYSYSAIRLSSGEVGGVFSAVHEVTDGVVSGRRLKTLREVADQVVQAKNEVDACTLAMRSIVRNPADCPYAMIFLCENGKANRVASSFGAGTEFPSKLDLSEEDEWGIKKAIQTRSPQVFRVKDPDSMPAAPFGDKCNTAISIPTLGTSREPIAVITIGISPYRNLDDSYREFLESLARNLAGNINNARAYNEERKRAEALAELDRAKTTFFSNVSHEFRTPLTLMLGPLEDTLAARDGLSNEQRERLEVAHRNSLRLLKLVNTLLDFSRIEAGRIQASYEPTDLPALTAELASIFRSAVERAGVRLLVNCPLIEEPVYVDREMWEKIVFNLLSNAFKFTFVGEIEVSLEKIDGAVKLSVRDTGTGIPEADLPHLFERFYRVKGASGRTLEGSGIGLALVQELARLHGGTVSVRSTPNRGSIFNVSVPLGVDHLPADRVSAPRTLESTEVRGEAYVQEALRWLPDGENISDEVPRGAVFSPIDPMPVSKQESEARALILIGDDNRDMREYVQRLLRDQYEVVVVEDGESALKRARDSHPDLILSDIMMPRLDGFGLLEALRGDEKLKSIPVILLSARAGEESRIEGIQLGADDYLVKPFSARELRARVRSHLAMARIRREAAEREYKLRLEAEEKERNRLHELFMQAPAAIGFLRGPEHRFTFVNLDYLKLTGRQRAEDFVGKTVREVFPELEGQGLFELLDGVYQTGVPYTGRARKVVLNRGAEGRPEDTYFDFICQPMRDAAGQVEGILVHGIDVTQQVLARQEIEKRERQFRTLADSIPQLVWMAESDGYIFWYNQRWYEYTGTTPEQMEGWGWQTVHDPEVLPKVLERWKHSIAKGEPFEMVFPLRGADDVFRDFLTRVHPVKDENGAVIRWFGTNTDVTAQRKAELAVRENERRFREMIDALPAAIYTTDAEGHLTHFNPAAVEFSGRTPELGTEQWCVSWKLYYPDGRPMPHDECPMAVALKEGRIIKGAEAIAERPDGTCRWFMPYPTPIRDSQGRIVGGINMLLDITDRKQAEEAMAHFAAIVASSDDAIISKNLDGIIQSWNKSAEYMFGYTADEAVGKHITVIIPKDRWGEERDILARLRRGEKIDHFQTVRRRKDGSTLDVSLTISPIKDSAGRMIGVSKVGRDITHLKRIERALRDSEERFRAMVETTPECVKVVAPDGTDLTGLN